MNRALRRKQAKQAQQTGQVILPSGQALDVGQAVRLGADFHHKQQYKEAEDVYRRVLAITPHDAITLNLLGNVMHNKKRYDEAESLLKKSIEIDGKQASSHNNLGILYREMKRDAEALACFYKALEINPEHASAKHMVATITGDESLASLDYVKKLFDQDAVQFESLLVGKLQYKTPQNLKAMLPEDTKFDAVMDIGCGTGLMAVELQGMCNSIDGIDLSANMLKIAADKGLYNKLITADAVEYMQQNPQHYDLFVLADVCVYIGDLLPMFETISNNAKTGAQLLFSTEICEEGEHKLNQSGRFAHNKAYLERILKQTGFTVVDYQQKALRKEAKEVLQGHHFLCEKV